MRVNSTKLLVVVALAFSVLGFGSTQANNDQYSLIWSSSDDFTILSVTNDYLLIRKPMLDRNGSYFNLIRISDGKELWSDSNDLSSALEKGSPVNLAENNVLISTKNCTSCFQLISGHKKWENRDLANLHFTKELDSENIIGSIDRNITDVIIDTVKFSSTSGRILETRSFEVTSNDNSTYNHIILKDTYHQKMFFLVNDWLECFDQNINKQLWQRQVTPQYLTKILFVDENAIFPVTAYYERCANYELTTKIFSVDIRTGKNLWSQILNYNLDGSNNSLYCQKNQCTNDGYPEIVKLDGTTGKLVASYKLARVRWMSTWMMLRRNHILCPIASRETGDIEVLRWDILNMNLQLAYQINMNTKPFKDATIIHFDTEYFLLRHHDDSKKIVVSLYKFSNLATSQ